jgi:cell fate regulator YaaT (PSP1 superfamily)
MHLAQVQFSAWDKKYSFYFEDLELKEGDQVVVDTELGLELGQVSGISEGPDEAPEIKPVVRLATASDLSKVNNKKLKKEALNFCLDLIKKYDLPMKLVDVRLSLSGSRLNFAFAAEGRVDFRQLVKDLTTHFNTAIRLTQIGARDEARVNGDCGHCGQNLCCRGFIKEFSSISSEMAEGQQVVHRGSDRISGMCGRLMCCLAYEYDGYQEMAKKLPPLGAKVNVDGRRGEVIGHHVLKQSVDVKFKGDKDGDYVVAEVDLNRHNKKDKKIAQ